MKLSFAGQLAVLCMAACVESETRPVVLDGQEMSGRAAQTSANDVHQGASAAVQPIRPPSGENPLSGIERDDRRFEASIRTRLLAGSYTYLELDLAEGERIWAVVLGNAPPQSQVVVRSVGVRREFRSARLDRTFDELFFVMLEKPTSEKGKNDENENNDDNGM